MKTQRFPELRIERAWYFICQQHRESVNIETFNQSEHDTRIWYHGTAASKECLQAPSPSPLPLPSLPFGSLRPHNFNAVSLRFLAIFPHSGAWFQATQTVSESLSNGLHFLLSSGERRQARSERGDCPRSPKILTRKKKPPDLWATSDNGDGGSFDTLKTGVKTFKSKLWNFKPFTHNSGQNKKNLMLNNKVIIINKKPKIKKLRVEVVFY